MPTAIEERYIKLHPKSRALFQRAKECFPDGVTHDSRRLKPFPIYVTHAQGALKWDVDGHEYIDYRTGHGALILGHSHPTIVKAVQEQMAKGTHYGASHELEVMWAEGVKKLIPSVQKLRFHSSGTEATLMALRMARVFTGKKKLIKFQRHFHGWHDYVTPESGSSTAGVPGETISTVIVLPASDITAVERTLEGDKDVAAVILEPTGAHMGAYPTPPQFLHQLRQVTKEKGVVFIMDEVVTGFRISPGGAQARYGVTPDLTTLAKILAGGLPGGAVAGRAEIIDTIQFHDDASWDPLRRIAHPGTFNANPLSAAAGSTALHLVATTPVNATADAIAQRLKDGLNHLLARIEVPGCCSGVASLLHLRLGIPHQCDKEMCNLNEEQLDATSRSKLSQPLRLALLNAGVDIRGGIILSAAHRPQDIDKTLNAFEEAFTALRKEGVM